MEIIKNKKWYTILIKTIYLVLSLIAIDKISQTERLMIISSPILVFLAQCCVLWFINSVFHVKTKKSFFLLIIWLIITISGFIISSYIFYVNLFIIVLEILFLIKDSSKPKDGNILKYHDFMILGTSLLMFTGISFFYTSTNILKYTLLAGLLLIIPLSQIYSIIRIIKESSLIGNIKKILVLVLGVICFIPVMYFISKDDSGIRLHLDRIIYFLIICIYPYAVLRISKTR